MDCPLGSAFRPTDLGLVRRYLRRMVNMNESSFITTLDFYEKEPWLLTQVNNPLFKKNVWYYFVPRKRKGATGTTAKRVVPGTGGSPGGFWKGNGQEDIEDEHGKVWGHKQSLTFFAGKNGKNARKTEWLMTEYTLHKGEGEFQDLVLCRIKDNTKKKIENKPQPQPQVVENNNNLSLSNNQDEAGLAGFADELENILIQGEDPYVTQQQQQQQQEPDLTVFADEPENAMIQGADPYVTQQQQQQQQEPDLTVLADELENGMIQGADYEVFQQQEEEIPIPPPMQNNDNNDFMMMWNEEQLDWDINGGEQFFNLDEICGELDEGKDVTEQQQQKDPSN